MPDPIKLQHFRNLVSLTVADGKIDEVERAALYKIAYELGVPLDRFNLMIDRAHEYKYLIPQNQHEREKQLEQMIEVALLDGEFSKAEFELITMVAEKLGFTKEEIDSILSGYQKP
ncbi:TerB family tellurite resistance protein [Chryseosolibacter indicus]|uniref:TerB family tellurite resistance protein n=1 Tax=Chryseosolibacter indicus TaxID=2782351 RepID=A0ABS5VRH5_9BACT|nr:TerB family tellurite resistance protein [Chryseosolibacter indicus]MBT1703369.1 TerB family tellurite resistance protein [Chryseosolibacter indicus]